MFSEITKDKHKGNRKDAEVAFLWREDTAFPSHAPPPNVSALHRVQSSKDDVVPGEIENAEGR